MFSSMESERTRGSGNVRWGRTIGEGASGVGSRCGNVFVTDIVLSERGPEDGGRDGFHNGKRALLG